MMDLGKLNSYIEDHSSAEDELLARLNRETHLKVLNPRMLTGKVQGKFLQFVSQMINPKYILEIGTYTGYSAICLAKGLQNDGQLHTIECNDEVIPYAEKYINEAGLNNSITVHKDDAENVIESLDYDWDLVFLDADKLTYLSFYKIVIEKLKSGAFILADNVLWSGKVLEQPVEEDKETKALIEFNTFIKNDTRVDKVMLPLRDGLTLIRKK